MLGACLGVTGGMEVAGVAFGSGSSTERCVFVVNVRLGLASNWWMDVSKCN